MSLKPERRRTPPAAREEAVSTPRFFERASEERRLDRLIALFQGAIAAHGATAHHCFRLVLDRHAIALFGNAPLHAPALSAAAARTGLAERPERLAADRNRGVTLLTFPVILPMIEPLIVAVAMDDSAAIAIDRSKASYLNGLSTIYAMKAMPLWEIEEDVDTIAPISLKERLALALLLSGHAHAEIAQRLQCTPQAVALHMANARRKLAVADEAEAVAIAARRGWLHIPQDFGIIRKGYR